jgi:hypothetical protein
MAEGVPAGFTELDRRIEGEIELVQFGLTPEFIGQGLRRYFLQWSLRTPRLCLAVYGDPWLPMSKGKALVPHIWTLSR